VTRLIYATKKNEVLTSTAYSNAPFGSTRSRLMCVFVGLNRLNFGLLGSRFKLSAIFSSVYKREIISARFQSASKDVAIHSTMIWLGLSDWAV
jgi:hypothetical protein